MRKVIIRKNKLVTPFNEPASALPVLNKPLGHWHRELLAPHCQGEEFIVEEFRRVAREPVETLVYADNLWFNEAFLLDFLQQAKLRARPARAAFRVTEAAFLQQGLASLNRSYEKRGDLFFLDLWYFPQGPVDQVEPVIINPEAQPFNYYQTLSEGAGGLIDLSWHLPRKAVCAIDSWVHLFFANIVFGVAVRKVTEKPRSGSGPLRALAGLRPFQPSAANITAGQNCVIDPSAVLTGRVVLGDNVIIGPGCVIGDCTIGSDVTLAYGNRFYMSTIGEGCFFPAGSSGYFSVFMENSSAGQNASLEMSLVGRNSYIGAGTIFNNLNLLAGPIRITQDEAPLEINMPTLGGCVGHNCRIGSGLVVYPGRAIESDVVLLPSPNRHVIMNDISYEESDHHAMMNAHLRLRQYPREALH